MNQLEKDIEDEAVGLVWQHLGIKGSKLVTPGDTSYPDRIFWIPGGRPLLIEFKRPGEEPEPKQAHTHDQLRKLGYDVQVHDHALDAFDAVIQAVKKTRLSRQGKKILKSAESICSVLIGKT